ncbi:hypothetical protein VP01_1124g5 [Puccinia sorghi]|uniref:Uncharacterized protein n=1 Tax=Puccinia sorghi TaxID=27349 RepID=A0A0L6VSJ3_9BASI|nr:hypothetical protein VP01_1124g5 [Puccinia sorghi]
MHLASFVIICLSVFNVQAADPSQPNAATSAPKPKTVAMTCDKTYLPLSKLDIAEMQTNGGLDPSQRAQFSTDIVEAVCQGGGSDKNHGGICDAKSCSGSPAVCHTCYQVTMKDGKLVKTSETSVEKVECGKGYFLNTKNDHNVCTAYDNKMYSCAAECNASIQCTKCVSVDDPALQKSS